MFRLTYPHTPRRGSCSTPLATPLLSAARARSLNQARRAMVSPMSRTPMPCYGPVSLSMPRILGLVSRTMLSAGYLASWKRLCYLRPAWVRSCMRTIIDVLSFPALSPSLPSSGWCSLSICLSLSLPFVVPAYLRPSLPSFGCPCESASNSPFLWLVLYLHPFLPFFCCPCLSASLSPFLWLVLYLRPSPPSFCCPCLAASLSPFLWLVLYQLCSVLAFFLFPFYLPFLD